MTRIAFILITLFAAGSLHAELDDKGDREEITDSIVSRYQDALINQQYKVKEVATEVLMDGRIPKLKKEGRMSALRLISDLGKVTWKMVGFWGDDTVKKEVMARYMKAEQEASENGKTTNIAISDDNYNFKYKGLNERDNRQVHILELKPKHKRVGLFKGELWLDPDTYLPVREAGRLVKNPSVFIKKMEFVRMYEIRDGVAYMKRMESKTETRIVGRAELNIEYAYQKPPEPTVEPVAHARGIECFPE